MALSKKITAVAADPKTGMTIDEFLEFAQAIETAVTRGSIMRDDILAARINMGAKILRLTVDDKSNDKGIWHTA